MIKELLLTGLVLLAAIIYVRIKASREQAGQRRPVPQASQPSRMPMMVAALLVLLTLSISGVIYYLNWQADHQIYLVEVTHSHNGTIQHYRVYRDDIRGRSFRTIDGREIHLSDMERMEVSLAGEEE